MKKLIQSIHQRYTWPFLGLFLILGLTLVLGGCNRDTAKIAQYDQERGAVKGTLKSVPKGAMVVLCLAGQTSCTPNLELSDMINRKGEYAISMVPPGHYILGYIYPEDLVEGKPKFKNSDILDYTFGSNIKIEAKMKDGNWSLDKDTSSETHLIASGATLSFGASGGLRIKNCSVKHKLSGLWMEYRDGHRYESIGVEPSKISELIVARWAGK